MDAPRTLCGAHFCALMSLYLNETGTGAEAGAAEVLDDCRGSAWHGWKRVCAAGLALSVKYVTHFTAFRFGCFQEALYSYMCCQGDLVKEM